MELTMLVAKKLYTFDEFEAYMSQPQNTDRLFELINGEIVEKVPTQERKSADPRTRRYHGQYCC